MKNCAKFIGEDGQTRIVNISECSSAKQILHKVLKKFNIQDDWSNWCIFITKERGGCTIPKTPIPNSPPPSNKLPQPYLFACTDVCRSTPVGRGVATILPRSHDSGTRTSHPDKT